MPKISFICPSYNHSKFVGFFIESLLKQTCGDFELIIVDDASSDNNVCEIKKFKDERIKLIEHQYNKGINASWMDAYLNSSGDIISFTASDDVLDSHYIELVLKEFENKDIEVLYVDQKFIDGDGKELHKQIHQTQDPQKVIFLNSFLYSNVLASPAMSFRKSAFATFLPLDCSLLQYQDYQMHLFFLLKAKISVLKVALVYYRIHGNNVSLSTKKPFFEFLEKEGFIERRDVFLRSAIETEKLMNTVINLIGQDIDLFNEMFADIPLIKDKQILPQTIVYWIARIALEMSPLYDRKVWGYKTIMNFISDPTRMDLLNCLYGFTFKEFNSLAELVITENDFVKTQKKLRKYRLLFEVFMVALCISIILLVLSLMR